MFKKLLFSGVFEIMLLSICHHFGSNKLLLKKEEESRAPSSSSWSSLLKIHQIPVGGLRQWATNTLQGVPLWRIKAQLEILLYGDFYVYQFLFATTFHHMFGAMLYKKKNTSIEITETWNLRVIIDVKNRSVQISQEIKWTANFFLLFCLSNYPKLLLGYAYLCYLLVKIQAKLSLVIYSVLKNKRLQGDL